MFQYAIDILKALHALPTTVVVVVSLCATIVTFLWLFKDKLKELKELKGSGSAAPAPDSLNKHCLLCKVAVSSRATDASVREYTLRNELLDRQMTGLENTIKRLIRMLEVDYLVFLKLYRPDKEELIDDLEYLLVSEKIKRSMYSLLVPAVRAMLKQNHLASKTDSEWRVYKRVALETLQAGFLGFVDEEYTTSYKVPRDNKRGHFEKQLPRVLREIEITLDDSRRLAIIYETDIQTMHEALKTAISNL